jgi:hypothetical protein
MRDLNYLRRSREASHTSPVLTAPEENHLSGGVPDRDQGTRANSGLRISGRTRHEER